MRGPFSAGRAREGTRLATGFPLAAVRGEVGEQIVHTVECSAIYEITAVTLLGDEARRSQLLQVEGKRCRPDPELRGECPGGQPLSAGDDQGAERAQTPRLRQAGKRLGCCGFIHYSIILEISDCCQASRPRHASYRCRFLRVWRYFRPQRSDMADVKKLQQGGRVQK